MATSYPQYQQQYPQQGYRPPLQQPGYQPPPQQQYGYCLPQYPQQPMQQPMQPQYPPQYGQPQYPSQYPQQMQPYPQQQFGAPGIPPASYNWHVPYDPRVPFVPPLGVPPQVAAKMCQASSIFRMFDRDQNGYLDKEEWKRAMYQLGLARHKEEAKRLFYLADQDVSNRITEREFIEFWLRNI